MRKISASASRRSSCLEARFCLSILPFVPFHESIYIHFHIAGCLWRSSGKAKKLDCDFLRLDALRGFIILVSFLFDLLAVFDVLCFYRLPPLQTHS
jgi:hypothetical protein